jgi:4-alpha-glucanotransferase
VKGSINLAEARLFSKPSAKPLGSLPLIADDLGATTPEVVALLDQFQIPGTRVLQFEFGSDLQTNSIRQHRIR